MFKKIHHTENSPKAIGPYSQAVEIEGFVYFSGQIPLDPKSMLTVSGGVAEQAKQVMLNIQALLKAADLDFINIIKTTIFLTDMNDFATVNEIYGSYFKEFPPARSTVAVAGLPKGVRVEVEVIAHRF